MVTTAVLCLSVRRTEVRGLDSLREHALHLFVREDDILNWILATLKLRVVAAVAEVRGEEQVLVPLPALAVLDARDLVGMSAGRSRRAAGKGNRPGEACRQGHQYQ